MELSRHSLSELIRGNLEDAHWGPRGRPWGEGSEGLEFAVLGICLLERGDNCRGHYHRHKRHADHEVNHKKELLSGEHWISANRGGNPLALSARVLQPQFESRASAKE